MSDTASVFDLVNRWQALQRAGQVVSLEELCAGCPEELSRLRAHLQAVSSMASLVDLPPTTVDPPAAFSQALTTPESASTAPRGSRGPIPVVPGYELLGELGRGGMGVVYRARQLGLKRLVALKMILAGRHAGAAHAARFRAEAEAVARLQHPNIVQIYEIGEHEGLPYLSLEFVDGGSLDRRLAGTPLPPRQAAELVETLARAVQAAHERGIVHRDLKPANVLLASGGREPPEGAESIESAERSGGSRPPLAQYTPKITDFGLAKQLDSDSGQTRSGAVLGTPSYMAPEQAEGRTNAAGALADVYALGAILYDCLTGQPPFRGATVLDTLEQVRQHEPVPPTSLQPKVPRDLETICLKCLHKEPGQRYASALALADDLGCFLRGEPILARPVSRMERLWRWGRRNPVVAGLSGALLLLLCGSLVVVTALWQRAEEQRAAAVEQSERAEDLASEARHQQSVAEGLAAEALHQQAVAEEQSRLTRAEADKAGKTAQILIGMFEDTDPLGLHSGPFLQPRTGEELTARQILDRGAERVHQDQTLEPTTRAYLLDTIGKVYCTLGLTKEAKPLLEEGLVLRRHALPANHLDLASSLHNLGWLLHQTGDYPEAAELYRAALAIRQEHAADAPLLVAATLFNLAWLQSDMENYGAAEKMFQGALDLRLRHLGEDHRDVAAARMGLAATYLAQHKFEAAVPPYLKAVETLHKTGRNKGLAQSIELFQRGLLARELPPLMRTVLGLGDEREAERCLKESLKLARQALGDRHAYVALVLHELAWTLETRHQYDEAERCFRDCLRIARGYGLEHPKTTILLNNFCILLQRQGKRAEAEGLLEEALKVRQDRYGPNHGSVADILLIQARLLDRATESERRQQLLRQALAIYCQTPGPPRRVVAACLDLLAVSAPPGELLEVACELARSAARRNDENGERSKYASLAMEALRKASAKGFNDVRRLQGAKELDILRERPDFQRLLRGLENGAAK
jgi:serine/threonine protein kinase/tetratricopeptide (TPR) repeat protein